MPSSAIEWLFWQSDHFRKYLTRKVDQRWVHKLLRRWLSTREKWKDKVTAYVIFFKTYYWYFSQWVLIKEVLWQVPSSHLPPLSLKIQKSEVKYEKECEKTNNIQDMLEFTRLNPTTYKQSLISSGTMVATALVAFLLWWWS